MSYYVHGGGPLHIKNDNFQRIVDICSLSLGVHDAQQDIDDVFGKYGFGVDHDSDGNICYLYLEYTNWNFYDDQDLFFRTIAPFVDNESHIDFVGEDEAMWRSSFYNGEYYETAAAIVYPGDPYSDRENGGKI